MLFSASIRSASGVECGLNVRRPLKNGSGTNSAKHPWGHLAIGSGPLFQSLPERRCAWSGLLSQLLEQFAKVRHLVAKYAVPCFGIPDFDTDDGTDDDDFFSGTNAKECSETIRDQQS